MTSTSKFALLLGSAAAVATAVRFSGDTDSQPVTAKAVSDPAATRVTTADSAPSQARAAGSTQPSYQIELRAAVPDAAKLVPRQPQPKAPLIQPEGEQLQLSVKFMDGVKARAVDGRLSLVTAQVPAPLQALVSGKAVRFTPVFSAAPDQLTDLLARAEANSGEAQADLHGLLFVTANDTTPAGVFALAQQFDALPEVEYVRIEALDRRPLPPEDMAPPTASFLTNQGGYRNGPNGIFIDQAWGLYNSRGQGIKFGDSEWAVDRDHEDLRTNSTTYRIDYVGGSPAAETQVRSINLQTNVTAFDLSGDHGTGVFGLVMAGDNGYGTTGITPDVRGVFASEFMAGGRAASITAVLNSLHAGDVMLLEMQANGPYPASEFYRNTAGIQGGNGPADLDQGVWDVVKVGTSAGVVVVVTAGNGNADLDRSAFDSYRARGDNGAILNGAGTSADRFKLGFSSHGSPLDLQGWGQNVTTLAYGDLANVDGANNNILNDGILPRQTYTGTFNGTSSAGPIVASSCIAVQTLAKSELGRPLSSKEMRTLLIDTATPQTVDSASVGLREAESLSYSSASGDGITIGSGAGTVGNFIRLDADADGDTIQFTIPAVQRGSYKLKIRELIAADLGRYQVEVDDSNGGFSQVGAVVDQYSSGISARVSDIGTVSYDNSGAKVFRLKSVGKNAAAVAQKIVVDSITLEATTAGGKVGHLPNIQKAIEKIIGTPVPQSLDSNGAYVQTFSAGRPVPEGGWTLVNGSGSDVISAGRTSVVGGALRMECVTGGVNVTNLATLHLNLLGKTGVSLSFDWRESGDETDAMPAGAHPGVKNGDGLCMSVDGITWYPIQSFAGSDTLWHHVTIPLDSLLAANSLSYSEHFRLRFQHTDDSSWQTDGIEIDNVMVTTSAASPMVLSPWNYGATAGAGETPAPMTFSVVNRGTSSFSFTASESLPWCSVSPASGTVAPGNAFPVTVTFNSGMSPGDYAGAIIITRGADVQDLWMNLKVMPDAATTARSFATLPGIGTGTDAGAVGPAEIYPMPLQVSGLNGPITDVNVVIHGLTHTYPADIDILLVGPQGQEVLLAADTGGATPVTNVSFTLDDSASGLIPAPIANGGVYQPTGSSTGFPGRPARPTGYSKLLSSFNSSNPNGTWLLYLLDDANGDSGTFFGYQLNISTAGPAALGLAEDFTGGADSGDLANKSLRFTPNASPAGYGLVTQAIGSLPTTHTAAAKTLSLTDDDYGALVMSRSFNFYGIAYDTLYIGSNGYVSFGAAKSDFSDDLALFLNCPRVAAMMRDLDPAAGGNIKAEEFSDRAVVTFTNIQQLGGGGAANTFQIEFFFDTGEIRISYLTTGSQVFVAGLSRGLGSAGFTETDLALPRAPWGGVAAAIPGKIEAENFDTGFPVAYSDTDPYANVGGAYRLDEGVDLEAAADPGGGYNIGWTGPGEWTEYTVNVASSGNYTLLSRFAGFGGAFRVEFNGVDVTGNMAMPDTAGVQTWQTYVKTGVPLTAGVKTMRVHWTASGSANLNHLTFIKEEAGTDPGLVARFKLDESNGTTVSESAGGRVGTLTLPTAAWSPTGGMIGGALSLPGGLGGVNVPTDDLLKLRSLNGVYSVSAWVKPATANRGVILLQGKGCSSWSSWHLAVGGAEFNDHAGRFVFAFRTDNDSDSDIANTVVSAEPAAVGRWSHVCATCDGSTLTLYVNGQFSGSANIEGRKPYDSPEPELQIGYDPGCDAEGRFHFEGQLDDLRIYAATLSAQQVQAQALSALPPDGDFDGDGLANSAEITWGLDPFDAWSRLAVQFGRNGQGKPVLGWQANPNKVYHIEFSSDLVHWQTIDTFTNINFTGFVSYIDELGPRGPRGFYRLKP